MNNFLKRAALTCALGLAAAAPAHADIISAKVTRLYPTSAGVVNVSLSTGCKANTSFYYQFNLNTDAGKAWYAMLLTAATNKTNVAVAITGACDATMHQSVLYIYQNS